MNDRGQSADVSKFGLLTRHLNFSPTVEGHDAKRRVLAQTFFSHVEVAHLKDFERHHTGRK